MITKYSNGTSVMCDCHGTERLFDIRPGIGIEGVDRRHKVRHMALIEPKEALERLAGTIEGSAILEFARKVLYS